MSASFDAVDAANTRRRALVLGGGGVTGIAWELGMIAGLAENGVDLAVADLVVGTSAGSAVGAQILSGVPVEELYEEQLADPTGEVTASIGPGVIARFALAALTPGDGRRGREYLGRAALRSRTVPEAVRREVIESHLRSGAWPETRFLVTAVDAETGEPRVFDRDSGVSLADAVGASCAVPVVWPPITIDGRRYMDGGVRSIANADLARGCDRIVVLAPATFAFRKSMRISHQLANLGPGVRSIVVSPDAEALKAIGRNVLDPARRAASARAGRRQAGEVLASVQAVWSGA